MLRKIGVSLLLAPLMSAALALPALAQTTTPRQMSPKTVDPMRSAATTTPKRTVDVACIGAAVDMREGAIISALDTYHGATKTALEARRAALKAAWAIAESKERRAAIKAAWSTFRGTWSRTSKALREAKRAAWKTYRDARKACGPNAASDDPTNESVDANL